MECEYCSKHHDGSFASGRFCNRKCARGFSSRAVRKRLNEQMMKDYVCKKCNLIFRGGMRLTAHMKIHKRVFMDLKTDKTRREYLIRERGRRCEICLQIEWMQKLIPLELDHKDGNPENNNKDNLQIICPNCHAQTGTYKGKNVGKITNSKRQKVMKKFIGKYR